MRNLALFCLYIIAFFLIKTIDNKCKFLSWAFPLVLSYKQYVYICIRLPFTVQYLSHDVQGEVESGTSIDHSLKNWQFYHWLVTACPTVTLAYISLIWLAALPCWWSNSSRQMSLLDSQLVFCSLVGCYRHSVYSRPRESWPNDWTLQRHCCQVPAGFPVSCMTKRPYAQDNKIFGTSFKWTTSRDLLYLLFISLTHLCHLFIVWNTCSYSFAFTETFRWLKIPLFHWHHGVRLRSVIDTAEPSLAVSLTQQSQA